METKIVWIKCVDCIYCSEVSAEADKVTHVGFLNRFYVKPIIGNITEIETLNPISSERDIRAICWEPGGVGHSCSVSYDVEKLWKKET